MKTGFIDWTEHNINLYVFERQAGQYKFINSSSFPVNGELDTGILKSLPASGCDIFLSIPLKLLTLREQTFPFSDKNKIRDTIPFELEGILLGSISNYSIDHMNIEALDFGSKVLAVCMEKTELKKIIDMFSSADLEPKVVTSLNLRLSGGNSEKLFEDAVSDIESRVEAAKQELQNPSINLRQQELTYMGDIVKFIKNIRLTAALILILVIILGANSAFRLITLKNEHKQLTNGIQTIYHQVFPQDKKIIDAGRQFKGNMNMLVNKKAALGGIQVLDILQEIAVQNNSNVQLHEFSADGKNIVMKGSAQSFEDVEALKNNIALFFKDVKVTDSETTANRKVNFTIIMQEKTA